MTASQLPVLIIGYSRRENIQRLIKSAIDRKVPKIYVSLDGPKTTEIKAIQDEILEDLIKLQKNSSVLILFIHREQNLGAGAGVISAIDWFFDQEKLGVVLEDDLVVDEIFFDYMDVAVKLIEHNSSILMIAGTRLKPEHEMHASLCSYPIVWGWATTRDKWTIMRSLIFNSDSIFKSNGSLSERLYWRTGKKRSLRSFIDAWDIPLASGMRANKYLTLVPPVNLVSNIGFDSTSTHTSQEIWPLGLSRQQVDTRSFHISESDSKRHANDVLMRDQIFGISARNIITSAVAYLFDPIRFRNRRNYASLRARVESGKELI